MSRYRMTYCKHKRQKISTSQECATQNPKNNQEQNRQIAIRILDCLKFEK